MAVAVEERALLEECYMRMQKIAFAFNAFTGNRAEMTEPGTLTDAELLGEMNEALEQADKLIQSAMQNPMLSMILKRM
jgi:hypothetical protein